MTKLKQQNYNTFTKKTIETLWNVKSSHLLTQLNALGHSLHAVGSALGSIPAESKAVLSLALPNNFDEVGPQGAGLEKNHFVAFDSLYVITEGSGRLAEILLVEYTV